MKTIVTLVDYSDLTFKVLKQAHSLAKAFGGEVVMLHVVPEEPIVVGFGLASATITRAANAEEVAADAKQLQELKESLAGGGVKAIDKQMQASSVSEVLAECKRLNADVIIVGSHSHGALYDLLIGSITSDVLRNAPCPVLVVP